jgi:hypothetical protein
MEQNDIKSIKGFPTKDFFVNMITRDIDIKDAIVDLLDNSIDGAIKNNILDFKSIEIMIELNSKSFSLVDNSGGFSLKIAKEYAFRFGRPSDIEITKGSVGRFGIGMKRALFKMGDFFEVESKTDEDHFQVDVNVKEWLNKKKEIFNSPGANEIVDDWSFNYVFTDESNSNLDNNGTYIKVSNLYSEVSDLFEDKYFINELKTDIERILNFSIEKGIKIYLNGELLKSKNIVLFSELSKPYSYEFEKNGVNVKVFAGLSYTGEPSQAGWYIYCNDRLVVEAEKSEISGWGVGSMPKFHTDYAMFKGVVFMDSDDTLKLPLTTTKKGIDSSSDIYKGTKFFMNEGMRLVMSFLKKVRKLDNPDDYRKLLGEQEEKLKVVDLKNYFSDASRLFTAPQIDSSKFELKNEFVRIAYSVYRESAEKVKNYNGASSYRELGENIFEYYKKSEGIDE